MHDFKEGGIVRYINDKWYDWGTILKIYDVDKSMRHMNIYTNTFDNSNPKWIDHTEIEPYDMTGNILEAMSDTMNRQRLQLLIDEALDSGDRDKFIEYSGMLKEVLVHA